MPGSRLRVSRVSERARVSEGASRVEHRGHDCVFNRERGSFLSHERSSRGSDDKSTRILHSITTFVWRLTRTHRRAWDRNPAPSYTLNSSRFCTWRTGHRWTRRRMDDCRDRLALNQRRQTARRRRPRLRVRLDAERSMTKTEHRCARFSHTTNDQSGTSGRRTRGDRDRIVRVFVRRTLG